MQLAVERLDVAVLHGEPGSMKRVVTPRSASQSFTALATNSGPLSLLMCLGMPYSRKRSASVMSASWLVIRRCTRMAKHSLVYSSTTVSRRSLRPSWVFSETKS